MNFQKKVDFKDNFVIDFTFEKIVRQNVVKTHNDVTPQSSVQCHSLMLAKTHRKVEKTYESVTCSIVGTIMAILRKTNSN